MDGSAHDHRLPDQIQDSNKTLVVIGAGGHGKVVADTAMAAGYRVLGFLDDNLVDAPLPGLAVIGRVTDSLALKERFSGLEIIVAVGDNPSRQRVVAQLGSVAKFARVVHPHSAVSAFACIGSGTVIMPGAVVNAGTRIRDHVILNTSCSVDHDCVIGDYTHISPGAHLAGNVSIGQGVHIGVGASVIPGCTVGDWSVVGAGAAVVIDIPAGVVAVGVPARVIRSV